MIIKKLLAKFLRPRRSMKSYKNYKTALSDSTSYEDMRLIEVVLCKTKAYINSFNSTFEVTNKQTIQNMFIIGYIYFDKPISVLELGGACGATYFKLMHLLPNFINKWHIVETPTMKKAAKKIFENNNLKFYDNINVAAKKLKDKNLIVAQGVLQYMEDPIKTLSKLFELGFEYVYITRTIVGYNINKPIITKQDVNLSAHGPGKMPSTLRDGKTSQVLTIIPYKSFVSKISKKGYKKMYFFNESAETLLIGGKEIKTKNIGFLAKKMHNK